MKEIRLGFVTDIHGSEITFRKALNASKMYRLDYLIFGGDISGRNHIPQKERE